MQFADPARAKAAARDLIATQMADELIARGADLTSETQVHLCLVESGFGSLSISVLRQRARNLAADRRGRSV